MFPTIKVPKKNIYLDYAATTPLHPLVKKAMNPFWDISFGNPSSLYKLGMEAHKAVENARASIATLIGARSEEIIFTAGGTESINMAIFGIARERVATSGNNKKPHLITSSIEHHAVIRSCETLVSEGFTATILPVNNQGFVLMDELKKSLRPETILISVMVANNEIGTIQPIREIGKWIKQINIDRISKNLPVVYFHTDACQAAGSLDLNVQDLGVDLMTVNGSKIYGPKQVGFLYVKKGLVLKPIVYGGGQEHDLRSGTENVPGIIGLAEAFRIAQKDKHKENKRLISLRDYFITKLFKIIPNILLNGPEIKSDHAAVRLPNNINISFSGIEGESLLLYLDSYGISVSTGSACASTSQDPSHVISALGHSNELAKSAVRFTFGRGTTKKEIEYVLKVLPEVVKELRKIKQ